MAENLLDSTTVADDTLYIHVFSKTWNPEKLMAPVRFEIMERAEAHI